MNELSGLAASSDLGGAVSGINWSVVMPVVIGVLIAILIFAIIKRALRVVIAVLIIAFLFPVVVTVLSGEGETYVEKFSSLFAPDIEQGINDAYQDFAEAEKRNPVISGPGVKTALQDLWDAAKGKIENLVPQH